MLLANTRTILFRTDGVRARFRSRSVANFIQSIILGGQQLGMVKSFKLKLEADVKEMSSSDTTEMEVYAASAIGLNPNGVLVRRDELTDLVYIHQIVKKTRFNNYLANISINCQ